MKQISAKQFVASEILLTLGMGLMLCSSDLAFDLGAPFICASGIILMTPAERSRPLGRSDAVWIVAALFAMAVFGIAATHFLSDATGARVARILRHPAFLLPTCILITWRTYRQWRHANSTTTVA
jgi:hypothetical protein